MAKSAAALKAAPVAVPVQAEAPPPAAGKRSRRGLVLVIALVLLAAGGGGWYWWKLRHATDPKQANAVEEPRKPPQYLNLEQFVVNLQDESAERYLQVAIVLEIANSNAADAIKLYTPIIRNRILLLLSSKQSREIGSPEGKQKLAGEILAEARQPIPASPGGKPDKGIEGVHFSAFVIQ